MGLVRLERLITKEQYERAQLNGGFITAEDEREIFSVSERLGYGIYSAIARKKHNEETGADTYVVSYTTGTSCD